MSMLTRRQLLQYTSYGSLLVLAGCEAAGAMEPVPKGEEAATIEPTLPAAIEDALMGEDDDELDVMIGQMFMVGFRGLAVDETHPIVADIQQRHLGGVVLFDYDVPSGEFVRNIESPEQVQALNESLQSFAETRLLIAADQEGGFVARLGERYGFPATLSHQALGDLDDVEETFARAGEMARTLAAAGVNQNLAPVVDVNVNPESPAIGAYERSFSADVEKVVAHAGAFIRAHHAENVLCTLKHFPGHGSAREDSHQGFVDVSATWSRLELEPYAALIEEGLVDAIMTAHVYNQAWDETYPATLSRHVLTDILRGELGYAGVVVSDDMQMGAIREFFGFEEAVQRTIEAGVDIIAIANNSVYEEDVVEWGVAIVRGLVAEGVLPRARIEESYERIAGLKSRLA